jgi:hypothetical protein
LTARPIYYGMLATELVGTGRFAALDNPDAADMRAYAVRHGHRLTVVLDDVQDPATNGATSPERPCPEQNQRRPRSENSAAAPDI